MQVWRPGSSESNAALPPARRHSNQRPRRPHKPRPPKPESSRGNAAGSGTGVTSSWPLKLPFCVPVSRPAISRTNSPPPFKCVTGRVVLATGLVPPELTLADQFAREPLDKGPVPPKVRLVTPFALYSYRRADKSSSPTVELKFSENTNALAITGGTSMTYEVTNP